MERLRPPFHSVEHLTPNEYLKNSFFVFAENILKPTSVLSCYSRFSVCVLLHLVVLEDSAEVPKNTEPRIFNRKLLIKEKCTSIYNFKSRFEPIFIYK